MQLWLQQTPPGSVNATYIRKVASGHERKLRRLHEREKRAVSREQPLQQEPSTHVTPESVVQGREDVAWVIQQFEKLPERHQRVVHARIVRGMTFVAIAAELGESEFVCRSQFNRALKTLQHAGKLYEQGRSDEC